jgi:thymidylate kinase
MDKAAVWGSQAWERDAARLALSTSGRADQPVHDQAIKRITEPGRKLVDFLARNNFPLLGLPADSPLFQSPELGRARTAEAAEFGELRGEFEIVQRAWKSQGIDCLMLKSAGAAPDFPYKSGNLDVMVTPGQGPLARRLLSQLGYVELRNCEEPSKFLFRRFRRGSAVCDIHLHLRIEWRVSFLFEDEVWNRKQRSFDEPCLYIPSPEDALLINLAHAFFENKSFGLYDLKKVEHCLRSPGFKWDYIWKMADAKGWCTGLATALLILDHLVSLLVGESGVPLDQADEARGELGEVTSRTVARLLSRPIVLPFPTGFIFSKRLFVQKIVSDRSEARGDRIRDLFLHFTTGTRLKLGLRSQPGFLITLSGVDGAGKTTQARALLGALDRCAIRTRYVWSRPGSSTFSSRLTRLTRVLIPGSRRSSTEAARQDPADLGTRAQSGPRFDPNKWPHRAVWLSLVLLDCAIAFGLGVRARLLTGHVVICDRYLPDAFADLAMRFRDGTAAGHPLLRLIAWVCPKPDFAVLLSVDPELARGRQEIEPGRPTTDSRQAQVRLLEAFARGSGASFVDASRDVELVSDQLVFCSLSRYFSRYRTLLNMIFFANPRSTPDSRGLGATFPDRPAPMPYRGNGLQRDA